MSGRLDPLAMLGPPSHDPPFFLWLCEKIRHRLQDGKTLNIVLHTIDRLLRSSGYDRKIPSTWNLSESDFDTFADWLQRRFGERAKDIVFVTLISGTPEYIRAVQSKLGMAAKGNMGGRPRKNRIEPISKEALKAEAIALAGSFGNNATRIFQHLGDKYGELPVKQRTIQVWMKRAKLSGNPGRPFGTTKKPDKSP